MHTPIAPRGRLLALAAAVAAALAVAAPALAAPATMGSQASLGIGAHTSFNRTYDWTVSKSVDQPSLTLAVGQPASVAYTVTVATSGATDSGWEVQDGIVISGTAPFTLNALSDVSAAATQGGTTSAATVEYCATDSLYNDKVSFPFTGTHLLCHYTIALPNGSNGTLGTSATFSDGSSAAASGSFDFSPSGNLEAGQPVVTNGSVDVVDSQAGTLGTLTAPVDSGQPQTYAYSRTVGPYAQCGDYTVDNTTTVTPSGASTVLAQSSATVTVRVACSPPQHGCDGSSDKYGKDCGHGGGGPCDSKGGSHGSSDQGKGGNHESSDQGRKGGSGSCDGGHTRSHDGGGSRDGRRGGDCSGGGSGH